MLSLLTNWTGEINETIQENSSFCVALFSIDGELLSCNTAFNTFAKNKGSEAFVNPTFEKLVQIESPTSLLFTGYLTLGDLHSFNTSVMAHVYRKDNTILVVGGVEANDLIKENSKLADLNREIVNLQRELLKKSNVLENALRELDATNTDLQKEKVTRDKLYSVIAHDLRSPFNVIVGFTDLLIKKIVDMDYETSIRYLDHIKLSAQNTLILLDNLLNWARIQTGNLLIKPEKVSLSTIILDIITINLPAAEIKKIHLNYFPIEDIHVHVDPNLLKTILRNLISNALKFTHENGVVSVSEHKKGNYVELSISDNGVGMDPKILKELFNDKTNTSTQGTAEETGSGLGLMLCKDFIEKLGGTIWAESELGKGSTFKFTLPLGH